jgi:hypothetical protein
VLFWVAVARLTITPIIRFPEQYSGSPRQVMAAYAAMRSNSSGPLLRCEPRAAPGWRHVGGGFDMPKSRDVLSGQATGVAAAHGEDSCRASGAASTSAQLCSVRMHAIDADDAQR